jgi:hypothetical protein
MRNGALIRAHALQGGDKTALYELTLNKTDTITIDSELLTG